MKETERSRERKRTRAEAHTCTRRELKMHTPTAHACTYICTTMHYYTMHSVVETTKGQLQSSPSMSNPSVIFFLRRNVAGTVPSVGWLSVVRTRSEAPSPSTRTRVTTSPGSSCTSSPPSSTIHSMTMYSDPFTGCINVENTNL